MENQILCLDCDCELNAGELDYEINPNTYLCQECYTLRYHPDFTEYEFKCDNCDEGYNYYDGCEMFCGCCFCIDCNDKVKRFNKCLLCYTIVDEDAEINLTICEDCKRQNCDCICIYKLPKCIDWNVFEMALWIKYKNTVHHKVLRQISLLSLNKHHKFGSKFLGKNIDDFEILKQTDTSYIIKGRDNKICLIEFYTEDELEMKTLDYVSGNICTIDRSILYENIKPNVYKQIIDCVIVEPEKVFNNINCPVCLDDYDNVVECYTPSCGHMICKNCYNQISNSNKCKCPTCRVKWDKNGKEYIKWEEDDIYDLCNNENNEVLNEIIDIDTTIDILIQCDGYAHILGYVDGEFHRGVWNRRETDGDGWVLMKSY